MFWMFLNPYACANFINTSPCSFLRVTSRRSLFRPWTYSRGAEGSMWIWNISFAALRNMNSRYPFDYLLKFEHSRPFPFWEFSKMDNTAFSPSFYDSSPALIFISLKSICFFVSKSAISCVAKTVSTSINYFRELSEFGSSIVGRTASSFLS